MRTKLGLDAVLHFRLLCSRLTFVIFSWLTTNPGYSVILVADETTSLMVSGNGDVLAPEDSVMAVGSGGTYALSAARALIDVEVRREKEEHKGGSPFWNLKASLLVSQYQLVLGVFG